MHPVVAVQLLGRLGETHVVSKHNIYSDPKVLMIIVFYYLLKTIGEVKCFKVQAN